MLISDWLKGVYTKTIHYKTSLTFLNSCTGDLPNLSKMMKLLETQLIFKVLVMVNFCIQNRAQIASHRYIGIGVHIISFCPQRSSIGQTKTKILPSSNTDPICVSNNDTTETKSKDLPPHQVKEAADDLPLLEVGLPVQRGGLDVAQAVGVTGAQQQNVGREDLVTSEPDEVSHPHLLPVLLHIASIRSARTMRGQKSWLAAGWKSHCFQ